MTRMGGAVGAKLSGQARPSASSLRSTLSRWGGSDPPFLIESENFTVVGIGDMIKEENVN